MLPSPLVSIILVSWNSAEHLPRCLDSLSQQTFRNFEIIVVDNGSSDQGLDALQQNHLELNLRIERLASNQGFAVANNIGARLARGKWLALLNADAFPRPDWLEKLLHAAYRHPEFSFFSSRQLQFARPDILDGAGDEYHISGLAWRRFYNHPAQQYGLQEEEVFSACAAAGAAGEGVLAARGARNGLRRDRRGGGHDSRRRAHPLRHRAPAAAPRAPRQLPGRDRSQRRATGGVA